MAKRQAIRPIIEVTAMFAGRLVLAVSGLGRRGMTTVTLSRNGTEMSLPVIASIPSTLATAAAPRTARARPRRIDLAICEVEPDFATRFGTDFGGFSIALSAASGRIAETEGELHSVRADELRPFAAGLADVVEALGPGDWTRLLQSALAQGYHAPTLRAAIDHHRVIAGKALLFHGWIANAAVTSFYCLLEDLRLVIPRGDIHFFSRPDITRVIGEAGLEARTALHGILALTRIEATEPGVVFAGLGETRVEWLVPDARPTPMGTSRDILRDIERIGLGYFPDLSETVEQVADVVAALAEAETQLTVVEYGAGAPGRDLSIVIPFYRDTFFLRDHIDSQSRADGKAEWLLVCDDPPILPVLLRDMRALARPSVHATRLLGLGRNGGYAAACNAGLAAASADHVVLMDPDIYWTSFEPLERASRLLMDDPSVGAVGFTLRYEDGTIEHRGLSLGRDAELGGRIVSMASVRGLPDPRGATREIREIEVEAVSSALMVIRRADFPQGAFDEAYVGRGYEDVDLCMRLRAEGRRIVLLDAPGLYHLERHGAPSRAAATITGCINCARFNRKWNLQDLAA